MRLTHYSKAPLLSAHDTAQKPRYGEAWSVHDKPRGLWVSVNGRDDWRSWCTLEGFRDIARQHATRVHLREGANVLMLRGGSAIDHFTKRFGITEQRAGWVRYAINWSAVGAVYGGLIITPYVWSRRFEDHTSWYYGWDCASGCIWDASQIERLDARYTPPAPTMEKAA